MIISSVLFAFSNLVALSSGNYDYSALMEVSMRATDTESNIDISVNNIPFLLSFNEDSYKVSNLSDYLSSYNLNIYDYNLSTEYTDILNVGSFQNVSFTDIYDLALTIRRSSSHGNYEVLVKTDVNGFSGNQMFYSFNYGNNVGSFVTSARVGDYYTGTDIEQFIYNTYNPPKPLISQFTEILVGGIIGLGTGVATGVSNMASKLFLNEVQGSIVGLSTFGGIVAIFSGLALAVGITTKVFTWVTSLGN